MNEKPRNSKPFNPVPVNPKLVNPTLRRPTVEPDKALEGKRVAVVVRGFPDPRHGVLERVGTYTVVLRSDMCRSVIYKHAILVVYESEG